MRWSWTVARIAQIDLDVHATFFILLVWIAFVDYARARTVEAALLGVLLTLAIFASVVLHEFGHALMARRFGVKTRRITLLPIGGVAQLERIPERPVQEFAIAIAGPAVTFAIVCVLFAALRLTGTPASIGSMAGAPSGTFAAQLLWLNAVLLVFNLLPAFPMDGGRVLRALLAMRMPLPRATVIAAQVGKVFAVIFALAGLFVVNNLFLVVIAIFVWLSAAAESGAVRIKAAVGDVRVAKAMISDVRTMDATQPASEAVDRIRQGFQYDFPVLEDHVVAGVLTRESLLKALAAGQSNVPVGELMERNFVSTSPEELLTQALERLQTCHCRTLPVLRGRELVGLLTADKINEFLMIATAERASRTAA